MKTKNRSNKHSPHNILFPCDFRDLDNWFNQEAKTIVQTEKTEILSVVLCVHKHLDVFVSWPQEAILLWEGRDRSIKYHAYPNSISREARRLSITLDGRVNGPAVAAYLIAGGKRFPRFGSNNFWSVHHIYSGKFFYPGKEETLHAAYDGRHCTQSAGLVAIHPIADQMCDEYPFFAWLLRAGAFEKFGYDPDKVFSKGPHDENGFVGRKCKIIESANPAP